MTNFEQNYNFNQPQNGNNLPNNDENKTVKVIFVTWCVLVAIPVILFHIIPLFEDYIDYDNGVQTFADLALYITYGIIVVCVIAHHILAIVGKIKFRNNKRMHEIFIVDMVLLAMLVAGILAIAALSLACDWMCGDCG